MGGVSFLCLIFGAGEFGSLSLFLFSLFFLKHPCEPSLKNKHVINLEERKGKQQSFCSGSFAFFSPSFSLKPPLTKQKQKTKNFKLKKTK